MGRIRWLCRGLGELSSPPFSNSRFLFSRVSEASMLMVWSGCSAGGAVTAMGVTADLIKVLERIS